MFFPLVITENTPGIEAWQLGWHNSALPTELQEATATGWPVNTVVLLIALLQLPIIFKFVQVCVGLNMI